MLSMLLEINSFTNSCEICEIKNVAPYRRPQVAISVYWLKLKSISEIRLL